MASTTPDAPAGRRPGSRARRELRYRLAWLGWALLGACGSVSCLWCPGYGASDAWRSLRPRRPGAGAGERGAEPAPDLDLDLDPDTGIDIGIDGDTERATVREVARGLRELERYLTAAALDRRPPAPSDRTDPDGGPAAR